MRLAWLCLFAACGNDAGAQLTLRAPQGPHNAAAFQIVLASPERTPVVMNQRISPIGMSTETVTYYLQLATAGVVPDQVAIDHVDGFTLRIEPNASIDNRAFIPFLMLFDAGGALVGMGTYHAPSQSIPSPIFVQTGEIDMYTLDVEPVTAIDATQPVLAQQALLVQCARQDNSSFTSGVAWRTAAGDELRVVLPDEPGAIDATGRMLDLDCDGHAVTASDASADCDDTRSRFHQGAPDTCDGMDTNCDGQPYLAVACTPTGGQICPDPVTGMGVALCDDTTGNPGVCQSDPQCLCAAGTGCTKCIISHRAQTTAGMITPCQPGVGSLSTLNGCDGGSPCTVAVAAVRGGWEVFVATSSQTGFGKIATGVGTSFLIVAKRPEGPGATIQGDPGHSTGEVDLVVVDSGKQPHLMTVDLIFEGSLDADCFGSGPFPMMCSP